jgi:hypothetical protein
MPRRSIAFLYDAVDEVWNAVAANQEVTLRERASRDWPRRTAEAVDLLLNAAGGIALSPTTHWSAVSATFMRQRST